MLKTRKPGYEDRVWNTLGFVVSAPAETSGPEMPLRR